jgi:O-methyltransferase domain/Dimerisation domain
MSNSVTPAKAPAQSEQQAAQQAAQLIYQLGTGYIASSALYIAVKLRIADNLANGPRTAASLASDSGVQEDGLYRVMRTLAGLGVFDETSPRTFALTTAGELLRSDRPGSIHPMALWLTDPFHFRVYAELMHSVKTGQPAAEVVVGKPVFEYFGEQPELSAVFNDAMTAFSSTVAPAALKAYDFGGIDTLVDVAGRHGEVLMTILRANPKMRGILFDIEHVIAGAKPRIADAGLSERLETASGDFFKKVPSGDGYIMKHIIHDWDDARAVTILRNIRSAMTSQDGRLILLDTVLQPGNQPDFGKLIDLEMMVMPGGRERSEEEFRALLAKGGFALTRVVATESPLAVIEARPQ